MSIIVPVYNVEKYLVRCIESILNQSFIDFELILVDDGFLDSSATICDNYAMKDRRIRVIHQENRGLSAARNTGIAIAEGEYISFIDSDDLLVEDTYAGNLQILLGDKSIDLLVFPYIFPYGAACVEKKACIKGYFYGEEQLHQLMADFRINIAVWNKIFHRSLFDDIQFKEGLMFEDNYLFADLAKRVKCFYCSDVGTYGYFVNEGSIMTSKDSYRKHHDRIISCNHLLQARLQFPSLKKSCFHIYVDLVFYYLGLLQCQDHVPWDTQLIDCINQ